MGHEIYEHDTGVVWGTTWHGLDQYKTQDHPVTAEQAERVLDYPMEKVQNYRINPSGDLVPVGSWTIVRPDLDIELAVVGERFTVENNIHLFRRVSECLLAQYPDLKIESVGTLKNGAIAFVNLKADTFGVKGDDSPLEERLMYYNPVGIGSHQACAHLDRIVCDNTLRAAAVQGAANRTLHKFAHTATAQDRLMAHLIDLSEYYLALQAFHEQLNWLAETSVTVGEVDQWLEELFPAGGDTARAQANANARQAAVLELLETQEGLDTNTRYSRYGVLQAVTNYYDHQYGRQSQADRVWSSLTGPAADYKTQSLDKLLQVT